MPGAGRKCVGPAMHFAAPQARLRRFDRRRASVVSPGRQPARLMGPLLKLTELRVFFFGDSICFGQGVSPHLVWVARISKALEERFASRAKIVVQNPSINGNTTRMALERIAYDVQSHAPHVLYVQFGMNDCNVWETDRGHPRTSRVGFEANLREIVARGRNFGARQVIMGANHPTTRTVTNMPNVDYTYEVANRAYNEITRGVARDVADGLADAEAKFDAHVRSGANAYADLVLADQLHLSERGHDLYFDDRLPIITRAVEGALAAR